MKNKFFSVITAITLTFSTLVGVTTFGYDPDGDGYSYYYNDYYDENTYSVYKEYKLGEFSDENSRFNGCDFYRVETVEAFEGMPTLETEYDYLAVPDSIIGNWFEYRKNSDPRFQHQYDVKLPLHTSYVLDESYSELQSSHYYDLYIMWKKVPYIIITADSKQVPLIDNEKLSEMYPDAKLSYINKNENNEYVYYLSTGDVNTNFNEYEYEVDTILTYEDAEEIYKLGNEHIIDFSYCSSYEMQNAILPEYPVYKSEYVEKAIEVFENHGYNVTIGDLQELIPDESIPPLEYFDIIFEIQERENIMPNIKMYENTVQTISNQTKLNNNKKGDINCDGNIGIADIVMLEKFLLGCGKDNQNADLNSDGVINVYDLILMRKELIKIN